jgi:hypothetical protein
MPNSTKRLASLRRSSSCLAGATRGASSISWPRSGRRRSLIEAIRRIDELFAIERERSATCRAPGALARPRHRPRSLAARRAGKALLEHPVAKTIQYALTTDLALPPEPITWLDINAVSRWQGTHGEGAMMRSGLARTPVAVRSRKPLPQSYANSNLCKPSNNTRVSHARDMDALKSIN